MGVKMKDFARVAIHPIKVKAPVHLPPQAKTNVSPSGGGTSGKISWKVQKGRKEL